jgi:hypothetical protein
MFIEKIKEISNDSKYTKWYISIIENAQIRTAEFKTMRRKKKHAVSLVGNVDAHHILPNSIAKEYSKEKENLVYLSYREHFICHLLLVKMLEAENKSKMLYALSRVSSKHKINSVMFSLLKEEMRLNISRQKTKFFEDNPEEKEKFVQAGLLGAKIKRDLDPRAWVAASMGNEESRAKRKETHNSKEFSEKCKQRELLKGSKELTRIGKERNKKGIKNGIEKYGSEAAFRDAHAEKIRGRVKIFNIKLKISKVVKDRNEYSEWKIFSELTEEEKLIFKKEPYSSNKEYKSKWIFNQDTLELRKMRVHISEDFILPDGFRFGKK